eukprot:TRINITY_DN6835_c0_g1_i1.p1 TRINITY_DN6835_c0_g1~~TRINITY_DN6835_c0_g1_i1.p1  ORF type:complete len:1412 (+),score=198.39 TRINITY_DN6835_c0_g1_i1:58-4293(+)
MSTNRNTYFPNFSKLSLSDWITHDFKDLIKFVFDGCTFKVEFLELPENFPLEVENNNYTWTKQERLLAEHIVKKPNKLFVLDGVLDNNTFEYEIDFDGIMLPVSHAIISILNLEMGIIGVIYLSGYREGSIMRKQYLAISSLSNQTAMLLDFSQVRNGETYKGKAYLNQENKDIDDYLATNFAAVWRWEVDTGKLQVNSAFLEILGYSKGDDLQLDSVLDWLDLIHPDDKDLFNKKLLLWPEKKNKHEILECKARHKSGNYIWIYLTISEILKEKENDPNIILGELHDITSQKKAWNQIEHLDPMYSSVVQAGFNWLSIIDRDGVYTYVNTSSGLAMGYTPHELIGRSLYSFIHPDDKEKVINDVSQFINNKTFISSPFRYQHKNGTWRWFEIILVNLLNDPMIEGIAVNVKDVSTRITSRKRLKTSEKKHRLLFNSSPSPKFIIDLDTHKIMDVNDTMVNHYGYTRKELLSMNTMQLRPKSEESKLLETLKEIRHKTGTFKLGVFTHQKKNGDLMLMDVVGHHLKFDGQNCVLVACNDISDREKYLESLLESEARLKKATSIAKLGYWSLKMDDCSIEWSEEVYNIWGRTRDSFDINYDNFLDTIYLADREFFMEDTSCTISKTDPLDFSHRIILPDGSIKWVHLLGEYVLDKAGNIIGLEGTVQDITQQKNEEIQLRLVESVVTNTKDAVMITEAEPFDEPGPKIIYVNEAFTQMTGYSAEEVIGKTPRILQGPRSDKNELKKLGQSMRRWEPCDITIVNYKKNGDEFWINFSLNPVADDRGWYTHWIAVERDVTEQKIQEHQKALLSDISKCFQVEKILQPCLTNVLQHLVKYCDYIFAEIYFPNIEDGRLTVTAKYTDKAEGQLFLDQTETLQSVLYGQGLPGIVWDKQVLEIWGESAIRDRLIRKEFARKAGISEIVGIPITYNQTRLCVLVLGKGKKAHYLAKNKEFLSELQTHLGTEIRRKQQELELKEIFNCSPDMLVIANIEGYIKKVNPAATRLLGYAKKELLSRPFLNFVHKDDLKSTLQSINIIRQEHYSQDPKAIQGDYPIHNSTIRYISKGGEVKWLDWTFTGALEKGLILAVGRDITEQKKLQNLLELSNKLAKIGSFELDMEKGKIFWSDEIKEIFEVDQNFEPTPENQLNFVKDIGYQQKCKTLIDRAVNRAVPIDYQMPIVTEKGNVRWIRFIGKPEFNGNKCTRIVGSVQDIHKLKMAQLSFKEAFKEKNRILESIGNAFLAVDDNLKITYWNKQAEILFEIARNKIIGQSLWQVFKGFKMAFEWEQEFSNYLDKISKENWEIYHPGLAKWLEVVTYPSNNGISIFIRDISDRLEAQKNLEESNERFEKATEATNDVIYDRDYNEDLLYYSKGFTTLFGHELNSVTRNVQFWHDHLHPEDKEPLLESLKKNP